MKYANKIKKCPLRRNCWDYGNCADCDIGKELFRLHKKIDRLKNKLEERDNIIAIYAAERNERKRGEWKYDIMCNAYTCTNCRITQTVFTYNGRPTFKFCPHCGADMRKGANE